MSDTDNNHYFGRNTLSITDIDSLIDEQLARGEVRVIYSDLVPDNHESNHD